MPDDDKYIKVHTDKRGKDHIDIYDNDPRDTHTSIHINWDIDTGKGNIVIQQTEIKNQQI